jgi:hypothetical protein
MSLYHPPQASHLPAVKGERSRTMRCMRNSATCRSARPGRSRRPNRVGDHLLVTTSCRTAEGFANTDGTLDPISAGRITYYPAIHLNVWMGSLPIFNCRRRTLIKLFSPLGGGKQSSGLHIPSGEIQVSLFRRQLHHYLRGGGHVTLLNQEGRARRGELRTPHGLTRPGCS